MFMGTSSDFFSLLLKRKRGISVFGNLSQGYANLLQVSSDSAPIFGFYYQDRHASAMITPISIISGIHFSNCELNTAHVY